MPPNCCVPLNYCIPQNCCIPQICCIPQNYCIPIPWDGGVRIPIPVRYRGS
jgi:hypothetical protein